MTNRSPMVGVKSLCRLVLVLFGCFVLNVVLSAMCFAHVLDDRCMWETNQNLAQWYFISDASVCFQSSWFVQCLLFDLCDEINRVGGHALNRYDWLRFLSSFFKMACVAVPDGVPMSLFSHKCCDQKLCQKNGLSGNVEVLRRKIFSLQCFWRWCARCWIKFLGRARL